MKFLKLVLWLVVVLMIVLLSKESLAATMPIPKINIGISAAKEPGDVALSLQILFLLTILTLAPAIVMMTTSFIRLAVVLGFVQRALATQQMPPTQVIMGLALFITFFVMAPTMKIIYDEGLQPYIGGKINATQLYERSMSPLREFMFRQTRERDIALFLHIGKREQPKSRGEVPSYILIPAFMISELKTAFQIGILLFIPFIVIDMVVASVLMSMGMIMLPPVMVSLPFKIILFVLVDGWHLLTYSLVRSFH